MTTARDHGPLRVLLLALTVGTVPVDAVSHLALGHVFVVSMTGNVVFFGSAVGGADGASWSGVRLRRVASLPAMQAGALAGGLLLRDGSLAVPLWAAAVVLAACAVTAGRLRRRAAAQSWG
ncbi:DUF1275 family protein [Streptomyces sp. NPDC101237]|uniref:DUF1275 family protein n=1 Tax=Streptomyces sp. NPDC101237 TaxID=3366139 RepID=UPI00380AA3F8